MEINSKCTMLRCRVNYQNELTREEGLADYLTFTRGHFSFQNRTGGEFCANSPPIYNRGCYPLQQCFLMIYFVSVILKEIFALGKEYPWERPGACPRCGHYRLWGHGYVQRYFLGFSSCIYLKCYRCPACRCVLTLRPDSHFSRIRASRELIREHLARRETMGHLPRCDLPRSSLRYWWTNLTRRTLALLNNSWCKGFLAAFDHFETLGITPVSRLR